MRKSLLHEMVLVGGKISELTLNVVFVNRKMKENKENGKEKSFVCYRHSTMIKANAVLLWLFHVHVSLSHTHYEFKSTWWIHSIFRLYPIPNNTYNTNNNTKIFRYWPNWISIKLSIYASFRFSCDMKSCCFTSHLSRSLDIFSEKTQRTFNSLKFHFGI